MAGCDFLNKSFSVAVRDGRGKDFCDKCKGEITSTVYRARSLKMCRNCFDAMIPSKEIGLSKVDAFDEVYDKDLGASYSSLREKHRIMKEKGMTYAEDYKKNREYCKEAAFNFGKQGNRKLGENKWI